LDFASILIKIGQTSPAPQEQTSPLNLMAIFLKRVNLLLDRSLNGMIRIAVEIIFTGRDLRIPGPDRSPMFYTSKPVFGYA